MSSKNPRRNIFWPTHVKRAGEVVAIRDMLDRSEANLFIAGTAVDGWAVYMEGVDATNRAQQVSPLMHRDQGDKLADLRAAAERVYGVKFLNNRASVAKHPAESWIWQTVEAPEERAARIDAQATRIVMDNKARFGNDVAGMLEWLETERVQNMYIEANTGNWIERDMAAFTAEATAVAIRRIREEPAAPAEPITAADDIAYWTLEAAKRPELPLWNNLDIPADVAEDIDASNWTTGSGLKDASGRREIFRQRRAEAYARMYPDHAAELAAEKAAQADDLATIPAGAKPVYIDQFSKDAPGLLDAVKICLEAELERRKTLKMGAPATTYTEKRIAMLRAAINRAEGRAPPTREEMREIAAAEYEQEAADEEAARLDISPQALPIAVRIAINVQNDNPNTIWNKLKARLGRDPSNQECRDEIRRIIRKADGAPAPVLRSTRTTLHPIPKGGANPVFTVTGREADGTGGERLVDADFNTREEAEAYRAERDTLRHAPGKLVGMFLDRNRAAEELDEANGIKPTWFGWREMPKGATTKGED